MAKLWKPELEGWVRKLLRLGLHVEAIQFVAKQMGFDLAEARQAVCDLDARVQLEYGALAVMPALPDDVHEAVVAILTPERRTDRKIAAIKHVRERMPIYGLAEAKYAVEDILLNRTPWPDIGWFVYHEVQRLLASPDGLTEAAKVITDATGMHAALAELVVVAISERRLPLPEPPPKYRSIDDYSRQPGLLTRCVGVVP